MASLWCETLDTHLKWRVGIGDSTADVDKEMLLVRVLVTIVLHKGGMFKRTNRCLDEQTSGQTDVRTKRRTDKQTDG